MANKPAFGASPSGGGLTFGTPTTSAFGFGTSFGAAATTTTAASFGASTSFNFGTPPATQTGLTFGSPAASTANPPAFGLTPSTAPSLSTFNFGSNTTTTTATPNLGFNFGTPGGISTSTNPAPAFGLGSNAPGLFGKPATSQGIDLNKPAASVSLGLGGVDNTNNVASITGIGTSSATGTGQSAPAPKTIALPNELAATVDAFKANVRQCKQLSSDIARCSIRPLNKIQSEADSLMRETSELTAALTARRRTANNLRTRAATALPAAERAHRVSETPHGLEYESGDAVAWITEVVAEGENRLRLLRKQLEAAQRQLDVTPKPVTDEELALGMRRIHESFIAVAGRLQAAHQQVEAQKAQYLSLRRNILKDPTDIFAKKIGTSNNNNKALNNDWLSKSNNNFNITQQASSSDPLTSLGLSQSNRQSSTTGPNPFSLLGSSSLNSLPFGYNKTQNVPASTTPLGTTQWGMNSLQTGQTLGLGNQSAFSTGLAGADQSPFALQKPPAGNKRGKH